MPPGLPGYLEELLRTPRFAGAERISRFLRFVVAKTLAGEAAEIKETLIATEVYGRRPDYDPRADSIVRVEASRLRAKLKDYYENEGAADAIRIDLPKGSYVPVFLELAPQTPASPEPVEVSLPAHARPRWRWWWAAGGAALFAAVGIALAVHPPSAQPAAPPSITILPFDNLTGRAELTAFSVGLADEVAAGLGRAGNLRVAGRQSGTGNAATHRPLSSSDREGFLLEGSIREDSRQVRIVADLVSRADGYQVWSRSLDADQSRSLEQQTHLAQEIAKDVDAVIADLHHERSSEWSASQRQAYQLYTRARQQMGDSDVLLTRGADLLEPPSLAELTSVAALFNQALALNPKLAQAHAGLAWVYLSASEADPALIRKARESAQHALALDSSAAEAYAVLGYDQYLHGWDFVQAEENMGKALSLQFRTPMWLRLYSEISGIRGNLAAAARKLDEGAAALPGSLSIKLARGMVAYQSLDSQTALGIASDLLARKPDYAMAFWLRGLAMEQIGQHALALAAFDECLKSSPGDPRCTPARAHSLAKQGRRNEAVQVMEAIRLRTSPLARSPYSIALIQTGLRDYPAALTTLESAYDLHDHSLPFAGIDPRLSVLADQPRFQAILHKLRVR